jgi:hypothetical protein
MTQLKALDGLAAEALALRQSDMRPARLRREEDKLVYRISEILKGTMRKMLRNKGMLDILDEGEQHGYIAIHAALGDWNPSLSSFSTHVHWKLRAEMRTLELHHFPERRKVCENINVTMIHLNKSCQEGAEGDKDEIGNVMNLDPLGYTQIEDNVDSAMFRRNIDGALSRIATPRINAYISSGFTDQGPVYQVMRDIHIFIQRVLGDENAEAVANSHGITRERIRQITNKIEIAFMKNMKDMLQAPRKRTEDEDLAWELALSIYNDRAGHDIRLLDGVPYADSDKDTVSEKREAMRLPEDVEYEIRNRTEENEMKAGMVVAAAAVLASGQVNAESQPARSRAVPPAEQNQEAAPTVIEIVEESTLPDARTGRTEVDELRPEGRREWAIKLGEHPTRYALRSAADGIVRRNPELGRYKPSIVANRDGTGLVLAFGVLELPEATRLCSVLERRGEDCSRIRIGSR